MLYYGGQNLQLINGATGDLIEGNYIGTDATGTVGLANNPYYDHENGDRPRECRRATRSAGRRRAPAT